MKATLPILKMLRRFDTSAPTIGKLYSSWFELGEHFETATESEFKQHALDKHQRRWAYSYKDIAGAAYVVDPEFHEHEQHKNKEVMKGFNDRREDCNSRSDSQKGASVHSLTLSLTLVVSRPASD